MPNTERLNDFPFRSATRQECPWTSFLFNMVLGVQTWREQKKTDNFGKEVKLSLLADDMISSVETLQNPHTHKNTKANKCVS